MGCEGSRQAAGRDVSVRHWILRSGRCGRADECAADEPDQAARHRVAPTGTSLAHPLSRRSRSAIRDGTDPPSRNMGTVHSHGLNPSASTPRYSSARS